MHQPSLHTLLIGVSENKYSSNKLNGCENDVKEIKRSLQELAAGRFKEERYEILLNQQATRKNIVQAFHNQLISPAQPGDYVVFYFSGHGGQEIAPPELSEYEADGKLEGLVCYDSHKEGVPKLIDKELRYLIYLLSQKQCDIITIFDCCHSGDNTRYEIPPEASIRRAHEDGISTRSWKEMLVQSDHPLRDLTRLKTHRLEELIPQGRHVHLAACLDFELAFESRIYKQGYFTRALVEVLDNSKGPISYLQLQRYVQQKLRGANFTQNQTPQIYTPKGYEGDLFKSFLFGEKIDYPLYGNVIYNYYEKYWSIDLGAIHGLVAGEGEDRVGVQIQTHPNKKELAYITEVSINHSKLVFACEEQEKERIEKFPDSSPLNCYKRIDNTGKYKGFISGLMMHPLSIYLEGEEEGISLLKNELESKKKDLSNLPIHWVKSIKNSSYAIFAKNEGYQLIRSWDKNLASRSISGYTESSTQQIIRNLQSISRWTFVKNLAPSSEVSLGNAPIRFSLIQAQEDTINLEGSYNLVELTHAPLPKPPLTLKFKFTNLFHQPIYFSLLYLDQEFGIHTGFLEPNTVRLAAKGAKNSHVYANSGQDIRMKMPGYIHQLNWPKEVVYFKLFIALEHFDLDVYHQAALESPDDRHRHSPKGFEPILLEELGDKWTTQLIAFDLKNPHYTEDLSQS